MLKVRYYGEDYEDITVEIQKFVRIKLGDNVFHIGLQEDGTWDMFIPGEAKLTDIDKS